MTLKLAWQSWKTWVGAALGLVLALDLALAGYLWHASSEQPEELRARRDALALDAKKLHADVERGNKIRISLPQARKDCDTFYQQSFLDSVTGYSKIEADLSDIATKSGVKVSGYAFKQKEVKDRGVTEVQLSMNLDADYPAIIQFINGLERSKNFYLLDSLHLSSVTTGGIRLDLDLHTFFRT
jgi:Tfp pilus assembly protein PilO